MVADRMGFDTTVPVTGQTYPRKLDAQILSALSGIAQSASKFANDLRLLQHEGEFLEPFESEQIGSSAMPYKRNPMRAERICSLARFVIELAGNGAHTAATQWLERSLDDSANRRLVLAESFLATDGILVLMTNVAAGFEVREASIQHHVDQQMPFMATERCLILAVEAGHDRQEVQEVIRRRSMEVAADVEAGKPNDLLERLAEEPVFGDVPIDQLRAQLEPGAYVGRSPEQVDEFLRDVVAPLLERASARATTPETTEISV